MKPNLCLNLKEYFYELVPKWIKCGRCCQLNQKERGFGKAREILARESNILEIIKQLRF